MDWWNSPGTFGFVLEYLFKTTAVMTLALLAAAAARRRPAAFRHFVLSFALIGLLLLPVLSLAPVGWRTALLPTRPAAGTEQTPVQVGPGSTPSPAQFAGMTLSISLAGPDALDLVLAALWSSGLVVLALRLAVGLAGAVKLTAEGGPLAGAVWRVLLERFMEIVSLRRQVRLKSHPHVLVPLTWGWRRPVILMPAGADGWTEEERSSALFHELSHVKRADFLVMLAVRASLAVFWWNPLCWVVYRELRKEQEIACDEMVLRAGIRPSSYAASLLAFRRSAGFRWNPSAALLGMLGRASFPERLAAILKQKLTFKEVKMKTRIMLAAAVVLAIALIGTARPAVGIEKTSATTTVVETAAPAAIAIDLVPPAAEGQETQTEKAVVQEKEQEKAKAAEKAAKEKAEKEKAAVRKPVVVSIKEIDKAPIVITITEGDVVKTMTLAKPLTITSREDGNTLVLTSEGKEIKVLKGEPLRLEIKGGEIELIKEGKDEKGGVTVVVGTAKEGEPAIAWTVKEPGKKADLWVTKEFSGKPRASAVWIGEGGKAFTFSSAGNKELLEKVRAIQEQLAAVKAKKMDLSALEESLKKLAAELQANEEKLNDLKIKLEKVPGEVAFVKKIREDEAKGDVVVRLSKADEASAAAKVMVSEGNTIQIILSGIEGGEGHGTYPLGVAAVDRLKKDLPEGYKILESKYDKEAGTMTFKLSAPEGKTIDEQTIRKLIDGLKEEIKKK